MQITNYQVQNACHLTLKHCKIIDNADKATGHRHKKQYDRAKEKLSTVMRVYANHSKN
jgi:hypothetical protein